GLARDAEVAGNGPHFEAFRHHRQLVTPFVRSGDHHLRQQTALGLGQVRVGAELQLRLRVRVAGGGQDGRGARGGKQGEAVNCVSPWRGGQKASQDAAIASTVTITDITSTPGMLAQASRAWCRALKKPTTKVVASTSRYSTRARVRRAGERPDSANTSATPTSTRPPVISQEAKFCHWIS